MKATRMKKTIQFQLELRQTEYQDDYWVFYRNPIGSWPIFRSDGDAPDIKQRLDDKTCFRILTLVPRLIDRSRGGF